MKTRFIIPVIAILFVLQSCGEKNTTPNDGITANFTISGYEIEAPCPITFVNTSTSGATYNWDFGDATPNSAQFNPTHTYTLAGSYNITLTVTTSSGSKSICKLVTISAPPAGKSAFSYFFDKCSGAPVGGLFKTVNPNSTAVSWDFGNGIVNNSRDAIAQFAILGDYTVKYSSLNNGVRDTITRIIRIQ